MHAGMHAWPSIQSNTFTFCGFISWSHQTLHSLHSSHTGFQIQRKPGKHKESRDQAVCQRDMHIILNNTNTKKHYENMHN